jgi:hypothetical protein
VTSSSAPARSSNASCGTIQCKKPFLPQIEQLHSVTPVSAADT